jgi:hypothetical protein
MLRALLLLLLLLAPPPEIVLKDGSTLDAEILDGGSHGLRIRIADSEFILPPELLPEPIRPPALTPPGVRDLLFARDGGIHAGEILTTTPEAIRMRVGDRELALPRDRCLRIEYEIPKALSPKSHAAAKRAIEDVVKSHPKMPEWRAAAIATLLDLGQTARPLLLTALQREDLTPSARETFRTLSGAANLPGRGSFGALSDPIAALPVIALTLQLTPHQRESAEAVLAGLAERMKAGRVDPAALETFRSRMREVLTDVQYGALRQFLPAGGGR